MSRAFIAARALSQGLATGRDIVNKATKVSRGFQVITVTVVFLLLALTLLTLGRFPADSGFGVCSWADASVVLPSVSRHALPAALPLPVPQRDEGLLGQSGRPGHRVEQFHWWVRVE